jgi:hypothetical protein
MNCAAITTRQGEFLWPESTNDFRRLSKHWDLKRQASFVNAVEFYDHPTVLRPRYLLSNLRNYPRADQPVLWMLKNCIMDGNFMKVRIAESQLEFF